MTRPPTPTADALIALLPDDLRARVRPTSRLDYHAQVAIRDQHWSLGQLATEATRDLDTAASPAAVIDQRIAIAATVPPKKEKPKIPAGRPFCSPECRDNAGWILGADLHPIRRCECRTQPQEANA